MGTKRTTAGSIRRYIVRLDSYTGDQSAMMCSLLEGDEWEPMETLYCVIAVTENGAEIVDCGYRSFDEAKRVWPQAI
jgi:hypothetical protein